MIAGFGMFFFLTSCSNQEAVSLKVAETKTVSVLTHCGYQTLELDINDSAWSTDELTEDAVGNLHEPAWPQSGGLVEMEVELIDSETLLATVPGTGVTHTYSLNTNPSGCM